MENKRNKNIKEKHITALTSNYSGITLIALVVTIVVLLILAGISISMVLGDNGIIKTAQEARNKMNEALGNELNQINEINDWVSDYLSGNGEGGSNNNNNSLPIFVSSIEQCTDTSKKYVLPDGYLYEYSLSEIVSYTNQIPISTDSEGNIYNGKGYKENTRLRLSTGEETAYNGACVTGFIPCTPYSTVCLKNISTEGSAGSYLVFYKDGQFVNAWTLSNPSISQEIDGTLTCDLHQAGDIDSIRLTVETIDETSILTINEEITDSTVGSSPWQKAEKYIPADWFEEVMATVETVNNLKTEANSNTIQFLVTSDIHCEPSKANYNLIENIGKVSAGVMNKCNIPFFMVIGDSTTQSSGYDTSIFTSNMQTVLDIFQPINKNQILLTVGNHDGATGQKVVDGQTLYYRHQIENTERANVYFGWQRSNKNKKFGPDGTYYYIDDKTTKTRYIMLNSYWSQWEGDSSGFTTDIQHSFFHTPLFGQEQLTWFANEALKNIPDGYSAIIGTHAAAINTDSLYAKDINVFKGIVSAYKNKTSYVGAYTGSQSWQNSSINVDYTSAKGELIAIFHGHIHQDSIDTSTYGVPCIGITTAGADVRDKDAPTRVSGTANETAIDVVTIDKTNRRINITRLGAGNDREIDY